MEQPKSSPFTAQQAGSLRRMKLVATGLLIFMAVVYTVSRGFERRFPWLAPVIAFAEAGIVGALADWFAVVALFRHPLNLPIPKTAVIPRNKERIGNALALFMRENFLARDVLERKIGSVDLTGFASAWIAKEENAMRLAHGIGRYIPAMIEKLEERHVHTLVRKEIVGWLKDLNVAPLFGAALKPLTEGGLHEELFAAVVRAIERLFEENKEKLREVTKGQLPRYIPDFIDERIADLVVGKLEEGLVKIGADPGNELKTRLGEALNRFIHNLEHSPDFAGRVEELKTEFLDHPRVNQYAAALWSDIRRKLVENLGRPDSGSRRQIARVIQELGAAVTKDEAVKERINQWLRVWAVNVLSGNRDVIVSFISETVRKWDPRETSRRIELHVGADLQWIRINGTLIGGLAGLLIYAVSWLLRNLT
ncbi:MAG: DUF445 domain-containing protein [Syntrophorhabdales bacterium]